VISSSRQMGWVLAVIVAAGGALVACDDPLSPPRNDPFRILPKKPPPAPTYGPLLTARPVTAEKLVSTPPVLDEPPPEVESDKPHVEEATPACPEGMVAVHGDACTDARQDCLKWLDPEAKEFAKKRCATFARPSVCAGDKKHLRFCIDRTEHARKPGEPPVSDVSWTISREICESEGKRLCLESEWVFACEGEEMLPYPTGFTRDAKACNFDHEDLVDKRGKMLDHRRAASERCASPFGVLDMVGNVDEWTWKDGATNHPWRAAMKGGWWLAGRNRCRPATTGHDEYYHAVQTGFRCCKDVASSPMATPASPAH
jgi:formylglycine-generating enzyme